MSAVQFVAVVLAAFVPCFAAWLDERIHEGGEQR